MHFHAFMFCTKLIDILTLSSCYNSIQPCVCAPGPNVPLIHFLILAAYRLFACLLDFFTYYLFLACLSLLVFLCLFTSLLLFFFENRPTPFPGCLVCWVYFMLPMCFWCMIRLCYVMSYFCVSLGLYFLWLFHLVFSILAKRLAEKSVSKIFVMCRVGRSLTQAIVFIKTLQKLPYC